MSLGERIAQLRKENGMNQSDLSKAMDVSRQAVSKWENDLSAPDATNLIRLADLLDTDIDYLTTGRRSYGRRPPVVVKTTETIEKIVEKPIVQTIEKIIEKPVIQYVDRIVEKPVLQYVEKPVVKYRTKYIRNSGEFAVIGIVCFFLGLLIGYFL